jgi:tRNA threonylcarbamoyladenosine biosynthesis protein TsaE
MTLVIETRSEAETKAIGRRLGAMLRAGDVVGLVGDLGAGKTQFTKGVAEGLGSDAVVTSPTFVLMNTYEGRLPLRHYDLYRLEQVEMASLGFDDVRETSAVVVEWGEKAGEALGERLEIVFEVAGAESRRLTMRGVGRRGVELLTALSASQASK